MKLQVSYGTLKCKKNKNTYTDISQPIQPVSPSVECERNINLHNALQHITVLYISPIKNAAHSQRAFLQPYEACWGDLASGNSSARDSLISAGKPATQPS